MNLPPRIQAVADTLARHGITFVFETGSRTAGDAWTTAANTHGPNLAVIHEHRGWWTDAGISSPDRDEPATAAYVSFDNHGPVIVEAFNQHGFRTCWDGDPRSAIRLHLT